MTIWGALKPDQHCQAHSFKPKLLHILNAMRTWIVAQDGSGQYDRIQSILDAAQPGDQILVKAGIYFENLRLTKPGLTLTGEGAERTFVCAPVGAVLHAQNIDAAVIADFTFGDNDSNGEATILLETAAITLSKSFIRGLAHCGILARNKSHLTLLASTIQSYAQSPADQAVRVDWESEARLEKNTLIENANGVTAYNGSRLAMRANTLCRNHRNGVVLAVESSGLLEENIISDNGQHGVVATDRSRLEAAANTIHHNRETGIAIYKYSEGRLAKNSVEGNGLGGVEAREHSRLQAQSNTLRRNRANAVSIHRDAEAVLKENLIIENDLNAVAVYERAHLTLTANTIAHNRECGVWIYKEGRGRLRHNVIAFNAKKGLSALGNAGQLPAGKIVLTRNCFWQNKDNYEGPLDPSSDMEADPLFADLLAGDYHLQTNSPCLGAGSNGEDLGAFPSPREEGEGLAPAVLPAQHLRTQIMTLPLTHALNPSPARPAYWLYAAAATLKNLPLCLACDLGVILTLPRERLRLTRPEHLPEEIDTSAYLNFLGRFVQDPLVQEVSAWNFSDAMTGVILGRLFAGVEFPALYALPAFENAVTFTRQLASELVRANPAATWQRSNANERPHLHKLFPPPAMAKVEANWSRFDREELRFLHQYGPHFAGEPDPRELLDFFHLLNLAPEVRLTFAQMLQLLPRLQQEMKTGGEQTYALGGYSGLSRKGSLDSLVPTELAYPRGMFAHRLINQEALYYGREAERERRRELAYIITQTGLEMRGDMEIVARAQTLALARALQSRGYEVRHSFAGSLLTEPGVIARPSDLYQILYYKDPGWLQTGAALATVAAQLRQWRGHYQNLKAYWVISEYWDADEVQSHRELYRELQKRSSQHAWFICSSGKTAKRNGEAPPAAKHFHDYHVLRTDLIPAIPENAAARHFSGATWPEKEKARRLWGKLRATIEDSGFDDNRRDVLHFANPEAQQAAWRQMAHIFDDPEQAAIDAYLRSLAPEGMVYIPAGSFLMGRPEDDPLAGEHEKPLHELWLPGFYLDRHPVTNEAYRAFVEAGGYQEKKYWTEAGWRCIEENKWQAPRLWQQAQYHQPRHPVVGVCWYEAVAYARWTGKRLPSEAEWEKAASWDATARRKRRYPWGDVWDALKCNTMEHGLAALTIVDRHSPSGDSAYGVADLAGNVNEWCASRANFKYPYSPHDGRENLEDAFPRALRGGSWNDDGQNKWSLCAFRGWFFPQTWSVDRGFRCAWGER